MAASTAEAIAAPTPVMLLSPALDSGFAQARAPE
jgi:hypothetical protein